MERPRLSLIATVAAGVVTPSPPALVPQGFDLASAQAVYAFVDYDGGDATARLQGSNDDTAPVNWSDIDNAVGTAIGADGVEMVGAGAATPTQALFAGLFKWVRLNLAVTGGVNMEGTVSASLVSPGIVGSGQSST